MGQKTIAVIPVRGGSKGLPNKNILPLAGLPLFEHPIKQAREAAISHIAISTDIDKIFDMDLEGVERFRRPAELAQDTTAMSSVLNELLAKDYFDDSLIVLLQATSPLRQAQDIRNAIQVYQDGQFDLVMSVCEAERSVLKYGTIEAGLFKPMRAVAHMFSNRQALPDVYKPNGAIYIFGSSWYRENQSLETANIGTFVMSATNSIDIDSRDDMDRCESLLRARAKDETE